MIFFILGFISAIAIVPVVEGLTAVILSWFEVVKSRMGVQIGESQHKIEKLQAPAPMRTIGFSDQSVEEPYEEEWEDEE